MRGIPPDTFDPFKSNSEQTPEAKLVIVRAAAREMVSLLARYHQWEAVNCSTTGKPCSSLNTEVAKFLNYLDDEEIMEFINERSDWEKE